MGFDGIHVHEEKVRLESDQECFISQKFPWLI